MPASACQTVRAAQVRYHNAQGFPLVPVEAAGRVWPFVLDTGAQDMLVTPWAAKAMGLRPDRGRTTRILGTDSTFDAQNVFLEGLSFSGTPLAPRRVPAAVLPGFEQVSPTPAGILGAPLLSQFDILFDGPGQQVTFYQVSRCQAVPVPFVPPLARVPLIRTPDGGLLVRMVLGGTPVEALLDTGARGTAVDPSVPGAGTPGLRVAEDTMPGLRPTVMPLSLGRAQAQLGMDYLGARRSWISYASNMLVVEMPRSAQGGLARR